MDHLHNTINNNINGLGILKLKNNINQIIFPNEYIIYLIEAINYF